jgi:hypothetical protein
LTNKERKNEIMDGHKKGLREGGKEGRMKS